MDDDDDDEKVDVGRGTECEMALKRRTIQGVVVQNRYASLALQSTSAHVWTVKTKMRRQHSDGNRWACACAAKLFAWPGVEPIKFAGYDDYNDYAANLALVESLPSSFHP